MDQHNIPDSHGSENNQSTGAQESTGQRSPEEFWCHQITPMMVPDPMCPRCHGEFVEKIEADNDPRAFTQPDPRDGGDADGQHGPGLEERVNIDDLFRLFQAFYNPRGAQQQQPQQPQQQQSQQRTPGSIYSSGTQIIFGPGMTPLRTSTTSMGSPPRLATSPPLMTETRSGETSAVSTGGAEGQAQEGQHSAGGPGPQWHSPPSFISGLLNRLGIEVHYTTDPEAMAMGPGFGGGGILGGDFFPIAGNPGDYAWGQGGLDDIITRMMELQNRQNGPVGATEEIIENIPHHQLTEEELEAKLECSVCKDEFAKEDTLLQLPCKHIFHEDCIKPWLKVSGTCPTCRYSMVEGNNNAEHAGEQQHQTSSGNRGDGASANHSAVPSAPRSAAETARGHSGNLTSPRSSASTASDLPDMEPLD
ncbi:hypothetical protein BGZ98_002712 [Dissophora globulifera]|nr:hypothetical protein BGZ98_002712 [Dissophora globulifera]